MTAASACRIGCFDAPQAGDPILADWGTPHAVKSVLLYTVWGNFSPEDALAAGADPGLRANRAIKVEADIEGRICTALHAYRSQAEIIEGLLAARAERRCAEAPPQSSGFFPAGSPR